MQSCIFFFSLKIVYTGMQLKDTCCMNIYQKLAVKNKITIQMGLEIIMCTSPPPKHSIKKPAS